MAFPLPTPGTSHRECLSEPRYRYLEAGRVANHPLSLRAPTWRQKAAIRAPILKFSCNQRYRPIYRPPVVDGNHVHRPHITGSVRFGLASSPATSLVSEVYHTAASRRRHRRPLVAFHRESQHWPRPHHLSSRVDGNHVCRRLITGSARIGPGIAIICQSLAVLTDHLKPTATSPVAWLSPESRSLIWPPHHRASSAIRSTS